jgi:hypothetical protein
VGLLLLITIGLFVLPFGVGLREWYCEITETD